MIRNEIYRPNMEMNKTGGMFSRYKSTDLLKNKHFEERKQTSLINKDQCLCIN